jgi:hypothetical protein
MKRTNVLWLVIFVLLILLCVLGWRLSQPPKPQPANVTLAMDDNGRLGFSVKKGDTVTFKLQNQNPKNEVSYTFDLGKDGPCTGVVKLAYGQSKDCKAEKDGDFVSSVDIVDPTDKPDSLEDGGPGIMDEPESVTPCKGCVSGAVSENGFVPSWKTSNKDAIQIQCLGTPQVPSVPNDPASTVDLHNNFQIIWIAPASNLNFDIKFAPETPCKKGDGTPKYEINQGGRCNLRNNTGTFKYMITACGNSVPVQGTVEVIDSAAHAQPPKK